MGIVVSKRVQYVRVILLEFQRIASHLTWLSAFTVDVGMITMQVITFREREYILDLLEHVMGSRMMYNYFRVGGLKHDIPFGFEEDALALTYHLDKRFEEYTDMCDKSRIFRLRSKGVGILNKEDALNLGATGPVLRASGIQADIRKIEPYLVYDELDFDIPFKTDGDCYSRYRVRMEEMHQSNRIIRQALEKLPEEGEISQKAPRKLPKGEIYFRTSDPRGEGGFYIIGNDDKIPYRVKIKSPAYSHLALTSHLLRGAKVADIAPIIASIDLCMGEIDR